MIECITCVGTQYGVNHDTCQTINTHYKQLTVTLY